MKNIIRYTLITFCLAFSIQNSSAQMYSSLTYDVSFPLSHEVIDFIDDTSWRGFTFKVGGEITENIGAGIYSGWYVFNEKVRGEQITTDISTLSGVQFRYINIVPIMADVHYRMANSGDWTPYGSLGIGTYFFKHTTDVGILRISDDEWHFGLAPEVGVAYHLRENSHLLLSIRYNHAFPTKDWNTQSFFQINVGLMWSEW
ncbi:outer membrane beta-barrel protein [Sediminitomix flava]|uniref:Outer membrane protein with beta-barrel domain n=1 Tax=Sediminitomix flava TaxID=379075 RepID=A0A315YWP3_SEDFL|nr:outer membrane beta-barrel protein [Sediminitomix flava]PWJ34190.1 outer membrane protein with beta-barrel domain [Sediminitomix flava]